MAAKAAAGSVWAPPGGSAMMPSMTPSRRRSGAVSFITPLASSARPASFHRMAAKPSGDRTE